MAWFSGKVSLGNFPDFSEAVNKLSESVKNIEKNFDSALGLEEKSDATASTSEGIWASATERKALFEPIMGFMGQKGEESTNNNEPSEKSDSSNSTSLVKAERIANDSSCHNASEQISSQENESGEVKKADVEKRATEEIQDKSQEPKDKAEVVSPSIPVEVSEEKTVQTVQTESPTNLQDEEKSGTLLEVVQPESTSHMDHVEVKDSTSAIDDANGLPESMNEQKSEEEKEVKKDFTAQAPDASPNSSDDSSDSSAPGFPHDIGEAEHNSRDNLSTLQDNHMEVSGAVSDLAPHQDDTIAEPIELKVHTSDDSDVKEKHFSATRNSDDIVDTVAELENVKKEMKMMETALQGAARQAQRKGESETETLREEYHQKVAALERKVYALTRERDTLRREQNKKSDAAALLKEKDEIINQVMAEGEELSKKQAAQESQMRKLRAQIRELEEEKKGLLTKLQVEENKVESIKRDKVATENLLQETVENHQAELAAQKEYYTNALNAAKEAEALAEARANTEARTEVESRLREAEDRESMLVQTLDELRQTLSRRDQQAVFKEDMLRKDIEDLQKRYQASERRCEELITQVPDSTRPLLRQIEAMQVLLSARRAEAWAAVERSLNSRLQEAEAKAATSEEKEHSMNERLTQTLSRINVLEAQISCLRAEQTQLTRSLEKERQRAAENRQEYLALKEEADTQEGRVNQLEQEIRELKRKHKEELHEALTHQELLQQELQREKAARLDQERAARLQPLAVPDQSSITRQKSAAFENGLDRKLSTTSSMGSMEESYFLQTTLDSSDNLSEHRSLGEGTMSPYYMKSMTSNTYEAALRQKEGELASYMSRLASMEAIRDSLAEELVKMTAQCEKLQTEAATLPGIRAELEALRRRHSAALELMGERDEELEELRADIVDLKEMYREQVNLLVNKVQRLSSSIGAA
ncbi:golgin candidate 5 [Phtheirospermum japonicum]|uniref:Golgin candidate 5 n=1 Tax=Phtheirospermum japonicum TaxID=374723 RepID=A0A830B2I6_9LAMI|nr:golgin candidate 5 [Phtheirospermum japonicum]